MSQLLDAIAGVANAAEPLPGLVTGGQPGAAQFAALKAAGCEVVLDCRDPMEPRPLREPEDVRALGLEYVCVPVGHGGVSDETFGKIRETVKGFVGKRKAVFHCASGNRVGASMIPYLMLDKGLPEEEAVQEAMKMGMRSAGLLDEALRYVSRNS